MIRLMRVLRSDSGIAMPLVMGVISVLTVVSVASFVLARQAMLDAERTQGHTEAFQIANAGADAALESIYRNGSFDDEFTLAGEISNGNYQVFAERLVNSEYELTAVGTDRMGYTETIVMRFFYINLWEMVFAAGNQESLTAGGGGINGNSNVTGPFYVRGTVELIGASYVHNGPLFVDGSLSRQGNAELGTTDNPIQLYVSGSYPEASSKAFYSSVSQSVPKIELPRLDAGELAIAAQKAQADSVDNRAYVDGIPEPSEGLTPEQYTTVNPPNTATFTRAYAHPDPNMHRFGYKYIGVNEDPSPPGQGATQLVIGPYSFGAYKEGTVTLGYSVEGVHDDFAYDHVNRILFLEGTVFVDGPVVIQDHIRYVGNGTIVANGPVTIGGDVFPYKPGEATELARRAMDARHAIGIATPVNMDVYGSSSNAKPPNDPPQHALALYSGETIKFNQNELYNGSIVAGHLNMGNSNVHLVTDPDLPKYLPDSLPGRDSPILTKGAWVRR